MKNNLQQSNSLRFRRWSRRAWAVFASLGREVTIGALRVPVSEQSLVKADGMIGIHLTERDTIEEEDEELLEICLPEHMCSHSGNRPKSMIFPASCPTVLVSGRPGGVTINMLTF